MNEAIAPRRRRASQARSKITVQKILDAAAELIVERGAQAVTMSEIARRSDLVIGSLYQYFRDKSAIYRAILIRHQAEGRAILHHFVAPSATLEDLSDGLSRSFDAYFEVLQRNRFVAGLWEIVQSDPDLQALDIEDTLQNARYVAAIAARHVPEADMDRLVGVCMMLIEFAFYTGRLTQAAPPEIASTIPATFKSMLRQAFMALKTNGET